MTSLKIWRILRNPPFTHPLFRRVLINRTAVQVREPEALPSSVFNVRFVIELLASLMICSAMFSPILLIIAILGLMFILNGTGYSALWAVKTSGLIAQARERQTYEIFCVSPEGALGVNWAICTGFLHRNGRLEQIHNLVRSLLIMALAMVGIIAAVLLWNTLQGYSAPVIQDEMAHSSLMLVHVVAVIAVIFIDHIHSIVLGSLVSILVPTYTRRKIDSQLGTFGVYLVLQMGAYLFTWLIALVILPAIYQSTESWLAHISLAFLQVATFFAVREVLINVLWQHMVTRLDVTLNEEINTGLSTFNLEIKPR